MTPRIAKAQGRSVKEWIGKTPDAKVPPAVRLRILRRYDSKCQLSGLIIADGQTFDLEHVRPLEEGGEHRESNLVPALRLPHELKTAAEAKRRKKADRIAKRAHGLREKPEGVGKIDSAGFEKFTPKPKAGAARIDKSALVPLGPPQIARRWGK